MTAAGTFVALAQASDRTLPIVFIGAGDPVTDGLVPSFAQPGSNVTGLSTLGPELIGKRLEQLKQAVPGVSHVAFLWQPGASRRTHGKGHAEGSRSRGAGAGGAASIR